ncbi:MAG: 50S ribosomal protein L29 [Nitrospira bacterium HGW-Nitrospira-1]|nr:MAG: 50S ribosomal protein L29 [Nitrospira bacterium HGW-Nitrospira-1]
MKAAELRESTIEELARKEQDMRRELFNLRFQKATGEIENPMRLRAIKKDIARVLTVAGEKKKK